MFHGNLPSRLGRIRALAEHAARQPEGKRFRSPDGSPTHDRVPAAHVYRRPAPSGRGTRRCPGDKRHTEDDRGAPEAGRDADRRVVPRDHSRLRRHRRFHALAQRTEPARVVALLDALFSRFDELAAVHGVEKIKTIGDSYMAAAGAPEPRDDHAVAAVEFARTILAAATDWSQANDLSLELRVGRGLRIGSGGRHRRAPHPL
ncbi:MAG TPA: adenylate/guanylate cyclase domain-containing protein [Candidatus Limnocylindria bacterium]|nr:adenylate/guanylate cyclase domain-containing protein [Candidatus Limnocylindria bacterium]